MGLSRKRGKELKKLRNSAGELWEEQREVLDRASHVLREAGRQLGNVSKEEVVPRVRGVVDGQLRPAVTSSYNATRSVVGDARNKVVHDVLPGVSASIASALATLDASKDPRVREIAKQVHRTSDRVGKNANRAYAGASKRATEAYTKVGTRVGFVKPPKKSGLGFGGWALLTVGIIIVAGIAYAAWQTLRADDELWVLDETDDIDKPQ